MSDRSKTKPFGVRIPAAPSKETTPVHTAIKGTFVLPDGTSRNASLANTLNNGNRLSVRVLRFLQLCHPTDYLLTTDFESLRIEQLSVLTPVPATEEIAYPQQATKSYSRLKVRMRTGQPVEVANIPETASGIALLRQMMHAAPTGLFYTMDQCQLELAHIDVSSIALLNLTTAPF